MNNNTDFFKIKTNNVKPEQGKILISEPFAKGFYFKRSIVLLLEYDEKGAMGFVLNKPITKSIPEIVEEFPNFQPNISIGGPVGTDKMYFIHTLGSDVLEGAIEISKGLFWGGNYKKVKEYINSGFLTNEQIRFFIGYSGWTAGQLDDELKNNYWIVEDIDKDTVMNHDENIWKELLQDLEPRYKMWANFPENPQFN